MATKDIDPEIDVSRQDQNDINKFGQLNHRRHELNGMLKEKKAELLNLEDASNEMLLADDDEQVNYLVGDVYVEIAKEQAEERIEKKIEEANEELNKLENEKEKVGSEMKALKGRLYAKFGSSINLEDDRAED